METALILVLVILLGGSIGAIIHYYLSGWYLFKQDLDNPYRRQCMRCGQIQEAHSEYARAHKIRWKDMGKIKDSNCKCHNYSKS